jgi:hypothetical protein
MLLTNIAQVSGASLTGSWSLTVPETLPYAPQFTAGNVAYTPLNGSRVSKTVQMGYSGQDFSLSVASATSPGTDHGYALSGYFTDLQIELANPTETFDPNSPVGFSFAAQFDHTYNAAQSAKAYVGDSSTGNLLYGGPVPVTNALDGSGYVLPPFKISDLPSTGQTGSLNTIVVEFLSEHLYPGPFGASIALQTTVNSDTTISTAAQQSVTSSLIDGRSKMTKRDFAGAAQAMTAAATTLRNASAANANADWIAAHVSWLAAN